MINIYIPERFQPEIKYTLNVILKYILFVDFKFLPSNNDDCILETPGKAKLILKNSFWKNINDTEYLKKQNLPANIKFTSNRFTAENDIPVIYGNDKIEIEDNKITCGIDVVASSFLMLSRWEETVTKINDVHNRFMGKDSIPCKNNFLH